MSFLNQHYEMDLWGWVVIYSAPWLSFSHLRNTAESGRADNKSQCQSVIGQAKQTPSICILFLFFASAVPFILMLYKGLYLNFLTSSQGDL